MALEADLTRDEIQPASWSHSHPTASHACRWWIVVWLALLVAAVALSGCSLTPIPAPARFHAAYWCPVETPELSCDGGMGVSLATWQVDRYGRWVSVVGVLGADTLGGGLAWTINQGSDRMPLIAVRAVNKWAEAQGG